MAVQRTFVERLMTLAATARMPQVRAETVATLRGFAASMAVDPPAPEW